MEVGFLLAEELAPESTPRGCIDTIRQIAPERVISPSTSSETYGEVSSLPIAYRLSPVSASKEWAEDAERRKKTEVPKEVEFQIKPDIALD